MRLFILSVLIIAGLPSAQNRRSFTGSVTDGMCPMADHSQMRMGSNDAECAIACANAHGVPYVLYDGKDVYTLSNQTLSEKFAGKKVMVTGTLQAGTKTIQVDSITAAN